MTIKDVYERLKDNKFLTVEEEEEYMEGVYYSVVEEIEEYMFLTPNYIDKKEEKNGKDE